MSPLVSGYVLYVCREIPSNIQHEIACVKDEVKELKNTTYLILSAVSKLAKSMESIGGINDRLTSLSKQVKTNDKKNVRIHRKCSYRDSKR